MISKKRFKGDGVTKRFLSDFLIRSEQFCRPYVYIFDDTLNPDGTEDKLQDGTTLQTNWRWPDNLWVRGADHPKSRDLTTTDKWAIVDNSVLYYEPPLQDTHIWIEVATTAEEFGDTLTQPSIEKAEEAAREALLSASAAATSATESATSATESEKSYWNSEAARRTSDSYATEPVGVYVKIHTSNEMVHILLLTHLNIVPYIGVRH